MFLYYKHNISSHLFYNSTEKEMSNQTQNIQFLTRLLLRDYLENLSTELAALLLLENKTPSCRRNPTDFVRNSQHLVGNCEHFVRNYKHFVSNSEHFVQIINILSEIKNILLAKYKHFVGNYDHFVRNFKHFV